MPKGRQSKTVLCAELLTLHATCPCGRSYDGKAAKTDRLFDMHKKRCPLATADGDSYLAEVDQFGNIKRINDKREQRLVAAVGDRVRN